jgi:hypothetical protein
MADIQAPEAPPTIQPIATAPQSQDVSRKTIVVLLILVTILSTVGTFAVLNELWNAKPVETPVQKTQSAHVQFTILKPQEPATTAVTGRVTLTIRDTKQETAPTP